MSLETALKGIGLVTVVWFLFWALVAMGPLGWIVLGPILLIGIVQVYRKRDERRRQNHAASTAGVQNCPDCGAPNDPERTECKHCSVEL